MVEERYPAGEVASRIERRWREAGRSVADLAALFDLTVWAVYKKLDGSAPFSVAECGLVAVALGAPKGWPFVEWAAGEALERVLGLSEAVRVELAGEKG